MLSYAKATLVVLSTTSSKEFFELITVNMYWRLQSKETIAWMKSPVMEVELHEMWDGDQKTDE